MLSSAYFFIIYYTMKKIHFFVLLFFMFSTLMLSAQQKIFSEDFEAGIPSTWQQSTSQVGDSIWKVGTSEINNLLAHDGSLYAYLSSSRTSQSSIQLISPMVTLNGVVEDPVLSFWMIQPQVSGGDHDILKIYYRVNSTDAFTLFASITSPVASWTNYEYLLSDILPYNASQVQIAFEYEYHNGRGIGLDAIYIGQTSICDAPSGIS